MRPRLVRVLVVEFSDQVWRVLEVGRWLPRGSDIIVSGPLYVIVEFSIPKFGVEYSFDFVFLVVVIVDNRRLRLRWVLACDWRCVSV